MKNHKANIKTLPDDTLTLDPKTFIELIGIDKFILGSLMTVSYPFSAKRIIQGMGVEIIETMDSEEGPVEISFLTPKDKLKAEKIINKWRTHNEVLSYQQPGRDHP